MIFPDTFDSEFMTLRGLLEEAGALEQFEAKGITMPMYLLITSIQAVTVAPFMNMFVALGEEVGWRGALYPYLKKKLGVTKGRIVGGTIWGACYGGHYLCKEEEGLSIKWIFNRTNKFQFVESRKSVFKEVLYEENRMYNAMYYAFICFECLWWRCQ